MLQNIPVMKISMPIKIKMLPPNMAALPDRPVPNFLPAIKPAKQMQNVTAAMISALANAIAGVYAAIVNPTDNASIEVAIPCTRSTPKLIRAWETSSSSFLPSTTIFPPINNSSKSAIHGIIFSKVAKYRAAVCTHTQPMIGMSA